MCPSFSNALAGPGSKFIQFQHSANATIPKVALIVMPHIWASESGKSPAEPTSMGSPHLPRGRISLGRSVSLIRHISAVIMVASNIKGLVGKLCFPDPLTGGAFLVDMASGGDHFVHVDDNPAVS